MPGLTRPLWLLVVAVLVGIGLFWWITRGHAQGDSEDKPKSSQEGQGGRKQRSKDTGRSEGARRRVRTVRPVKGGLPRQSIQPATIEAFFYADLYAKISGYLKQQPVDIGDTVTQGQLVAEIDAPEYQQQLKNAEAELKRAQTEVMLAEARLHTREAEHKSALAGVDQAKSDLKKAQANLKFREIQYARISELFAKNAIEERLVDEKDEERHAAAATEISARAAIVTASADADAAEARVEQAKAEVEDARAKVEVAEAKVGNAQVFVDYTRILSPYNGVITQRGYHVGDFIRAAEDERQPPMLTVAQTDVMRTVVLVPERDAAYTNRGDKAVVELDAIPDRKFTAKVSRISSSESRTTRAMRVEVDLQNEDHLLRDGMFGRVTISLDKSIDALTLPASSVMANEEGTESYVYVVKQGQAHKQKVKTGRNNGVRVEITSGISKDDEVIEQPTAYVTDGTPVEVEKHEDGEDGDAKGRQKKPEKDKSDDGDESGRQGRKA